jgi:cell division protein FtsB
LRSEVSLDPEEEARVEELLRINAELAAEVRSLREGVGARSASVPAARRIAQVLAELEFTRGELAAQSASLESALAELAAREEELSQLRRRVDELQREVTRLRSGVAGFLRRARARLLRS